MNNLADKHKTARMHPCLTPKMIGRCAKRRRAAWGSDGASSPQRGDALGHFIAREEATMTAQWIATALGAAASLGRSAAPMSNVEFFFLRAALLIFVIVAVSGAAIRLTRRN